MIADNNDTPTGFDTVIWLFRTIHKIQNLWHILRNRNPNLSDILKEIFQAIHKIQTFWPILRIRISFLARCPWDESRGHVPFAMACSMWVPISVPVNHTRSTNDSHYAMQNPLGLYLLLRVHLSESIAWLQVMTHSTRCSVSTFLCSLLLMIQLLPLVPRPVVKINQTVT